MIQSKISQITTMLDGLTLNYGVKVLSGSTKQTMYKDTGEYSDDRTIGIPCVLMPFVSVYDFEQAMTGEQSILEAAWYEGEVKSENLIVSGKNGYTISGEGYPKYSLEVAKNVPADKPMQINCVFKFLDSRKGTVVICEGNTNFMTSLYAENSYSVKIAQPQNYSVNPLDYADNDTAWMQTLEAQMYNGTDAVEANVKYQWEVLDGTSWRVFNADEIGLFVFVDGNQLKVDARFFKKLSVRVKAMVYEGTEPSKIVDESIVDYCTINVAMPHALTTEVYQSKGMKIGANMNTTVEYTCLLKDSKKELTDKYNFFRIQWFVKSAKIASKEILLGEGKTIKFNPSTLGLDATYSMSVYAKVYSYAVTAFLVNNSGQYLTGAGGELLTTKYFE